MSGTSFTCYRCGTRLTTPDELFQHGRVCLLRLVQDAVRKALAERTDGGSGFLSVGELWDLLEYLEVPIEREEFDLLIEDFFSRKAAGTLPPPLQ